MILSLLLLAAQASLPEVRVEGSDCVRASDLRDALVRDDPPPVGSAVLRLVLTSTAGRLDARVEFRSPRGNDARRFSLAPGECGLVPRVVVRMYRRYAERLPQLRPLKTLAPLMLRPRWWDRQDLYLEAASAFDGVRLPRLGVRAGWTLGPLARVHLLVAGGYDAIIDRPLDDGVIRLHRGWLAVGAGEDFALGPLVTALEALVGAGAAWSSGGGFARTGSAFLPSAWARVQTRIRWGGYANVRPHVGLAAEVPIVRARLLGPSSTYEEPWVRGELTLGLTWSWIR